MIEKINPTIPIPITSSPIPDEQREIIMAKSSIAIPNPIFFIVNPPLQIPICHSDLSILYDDIVTFSTVKFAVCICGMGLLPYRRRIIFPAHFCALRFSEPEWRAALLYALQVVFQWLSTAAPAN